MIPVAFRTRKGLNYPWGIRANGNSAWEGWLSDTYVAAPNQQALSHIRGMGTLSCASWLWLDRMLANKTDSSWGTGSFRPDWNRQYVDNFEEFMAAVAREGLEMMWTLLVGGDDSTYNWDTDALDTPGAGKWVDYITTIREWVGMYDRKTRIGRSIPAYILIKEAPIATRYAFIQAIYQDLARNVPHRPPIGVDVTGINDPTANMYAVLAAYDADSGGEIADFECWHAYTNGGFQHTVPPRKKPFMIGECGAANTGSPQPNTVAEWQLPALEAFYAKGILAGAKCVMAYSWTTNATIATKTVVGGQLQLGYGPAGEWIRDHDVNRPRRDTGRLGLWGNA